MTTTITLSLYHLLLWGYFGVGSVPQKYFRRRTFVAVGTSFFLAIITGDMQEMRLFIGRIIVMYECV